MSQSMKHRFQLWGWIIFIVSALSFIASSWRAGDPVSLIGGILFLLACFVFLVPLIAEAAETSSNLSRLRRYFRYPRDWFRAARCLSRVPAGPTIWPAPEHLQAQNRRLQVRSELRFFASTR